VILIKYGILWSVKMLKLKELRISKKVSQDEVATYLGITQQAYANYERGARNPDPETLSKLADYFSVTTDYILGRASTPSGDAFALSSDTDYDDLPPEALEEIEQFKEFVRTKYKKK
jgi:transcriptional regulator with XRE-family HTH domain